jgi:hypothetical protein
MHQWNIHVDIVNATRLIEGLTPLEPSAVTLDGYHSTVSLRGELGIPFCADAMEFVSGIADRSDFSFFHMKPHSLSPSAVNATGLRLELPLRRRADESAGVREQHEQFVSGFVEYWKSISHVTGLEPELWVNDDGSHIDTHYFTVDRGFLSPYELYLIDQLPKEQSVTLEALKSWQK